MIVFLTELGCVHEVITSVKNICHVTLIVCLHTAVINNNTVNCDLNQEGMVMFQKKISH